MNRADIADCLGLTTETVGNTFTSLRGSDAIASSPAIRSCWKTSKVCSNSPTAAKGTTEPSLLLHCSKCSKQPFEFLRVAVLGSFGRT